MDQEADWRAFFERYPDIKEPKSSAPNGDAAVTTFTVDDPALDSWEEDGSDEEYAVDGDDEPEPAYSSSSVSRQPPTPDLLRNTANARRTGSCK